jgi:hypothetical protein
MAVALAVGVGVLVAATLVFASSDGKEHAQRSLHLSVTPECSKDGNGPLLPEIPRVDLKATFTVHVALSGAVERIDLISHEPKNVEVNQLWERFANCWKQKARYDTTGIAPAEFPVEQSLVVKWASRDSVARPQD